MSGIDTLQIGWSGVQELPEFFDLLVCGMLGKGAEADGPDKFVTRAPARAMPKADCRSEVQPVYTDTRIAFGGHSDIADRVPVSCDRSVEYANVIFATIDAHDLDARPCPVIAHTAISEWVAGTRSWEE
jgi:hypothetical protein